MCVGARKRDRVAGQGREGGGEGGGGGSIVNMATDALTTLSTAKAFDVQIMAVRKGKQ